MGSRLSPKGRTARPTAEEPSSTVAVPWAPGQPSIPAQKFPSQAWGTSSHGSSHECAAAIGPERRPESECPIRTQAFSELSSHRCLLGPGGRANGPVVTPPWLRRKRESQPRTGRPLLRPRICSGFHEISNFTKSQPSSGRITGRIPPTVAALLDPVHFAVQRAPTTVINTSQGFLRSIGPLFPLWFQTPGNRLERLTSQKEGGPWPRGLTMVLVYPTLGSWVFGLVRCNLEPTRLDQRQDHHGISFVFLYGSR
ncbi:hypothetical protein CPAR01_14723 [Colletotrichum paranaense]|uniref:Uncharacterized protein n=1 Tax=Colletotrichum paranaense TaxID=1914294 RepID=A0ABQ9S199_9PEZI|nr:uncharacterized protein CPAR01_14723 [Colletotrichum paranaense]KAK1521806.1 hypothetical protein CPAR01_14723 [Colletotrichum paranaense]